MSKTEEKSVCASAKYIKGSVRKILPLTHVVAGLKVSNALDVLRFSKKVAAKDIYKIIFAAVANAENNFNYDADSLYIKEIFIGKSLILKRQMPRARGSASGFKKYFSTVKVVLNVK